MRNTTGQSRGNAAGKARWGRLGAAASAAALATGAWAAGAGVAAAGGPPTTFASPSAKPGGAGTTVAHAGAAASPGGCARAGTSKLTAKLVAHDHETVSGAVEASGCDIGIYVPPGAVGVVVRGATVTGAADQGILVQDANGVVIEDSTVTGDLVRPDVCPLPPAKPKGPCIVDAKAVELVGSSHSTVEGNTIVANLGEGGIGVFDDGAQSPGTLGAGLPRPAIGNLVEHNVVVDNRRGCGIVVSTHVAGEAVKANKVIDNVSVGNAEGVVVADNMPHTELSGTVVRGNVATDSVAPGIVLNSLAPGDVVSGTLVEDNVLSRNGGLPPFEHLPGYVPKPTGVIVVTAGLPPGAPKGTVAPVQVGVRLVGNVISDEGWGIWSTPQNHLSITGTVVRGVAASRA